MELIISKTKIFIFFAILIYIGTFQWIYVSWLNPNCMYFGYTYVKPPVQFYGLAWVLALAPLLWMPLVITRPSQFIYWTLYLTVIIPSMFVPLYMGLETPSEVSFLMLTMILGFWLLGTSYLRRLFFVKNISVEPATFWWFFWIVYAMLNIWILIFFGKNLRVANYYEVYDLRESASDMMKGTFANYPVMWLAAIFNPFLIACGLNSAKRWMIGIGVMDQLLVYATDASRMRLLAIPIIVVIYFYAKNRAGKVPVFKMVWVVAVFLFSLMAVHSVFQDTGEPDWLNILCNMVFMRTIATPGYTTGIYYDFFQTHPFTYFSHVHGINLLIEYPYQNAIGVEVGKYELGQYAFDANAHLWATDGIGGLGLLGVLIISVLGAIVFFVMDSALSKKSMALLLPALCYSAMQFSNISLFTCLFSGGLFFLSTILYFFPGFSIKGEK